MYDHDSLFPAFPDLLLLWLFDNYKHIEPTIEGECHATAKKVWSLLQMPGIKKETEIYHSQLKWPRKSSLRELELFLGD